MFYLFIWLIKRNDRCVASRLQFDWPKKCRTYRHLNLGERAIVGALSTNQLNL